MVRAARKPLPAHAARACSQPACPRPARTGWHRDLTRTAPPRARRAPVPSPHRSARDGRRGPCRLPDVAQPPSAERHQGWPPPTRTRRPRRAHLGRVRHPAARSRPPRHNQRHLTGDRAEHPVMARSERSRSHADRRADRRLFARGRRAGAITESEVESGRHAAGSPIRRFNGNAGRGTGERADYLFWRTGLPHRQLQAARTRAGFPCSARVRHGRDRVPSVPRGRRCLHGHACIPWPPPAALQRPVPVTPVPQPIPGCFPHEASARVHWHSPLPAIPLTCNPRTEREPLGFTLGFTPGRAGPSRACQGGDEPQALARDHAIAISDLPQRTHSTRAASRRNACRK